VRGEGNGTVKLSSDLFAHLERAYGLAFGGTVRLRTVVGVKTSGGAMMIKRYQGTGMRRRLDALGEALDLAVQEGMEIAPYLQTRQGNYALEHDGGLWTLQPWLPGRHTAMTERGERTAAASSLAKLHAVPIGGRIERAMFLQVPPLWEKYRYRLEKAQEATLKATSLRDLWRPFAERARSSLTRLRTVTQRALDQDLRHGSLCHRDPAPHNLIWQGGGTALIDFDLAGFDVRAHDLYQLLNHALYLNGWEPGLFTEMIEAYDRVYPIGQENGRVLEALLSYPALVVREWYEFGKSNDRRVFWSRLQWAVAQEQRREREQQKGTSP
jgi:Ser/Thr protein kinase RdoA (MazF antagonist)